MPRVSVIIPAYIDDPDKIVWFGEALQSVKDQTFTDWEAIVIDDYSPVDIGEIKVRFEADERFRWFKTSHNNGSPATVRNTAVALAESEAILPLDADDMLGSNEAIERMYQAWQADKTRIIYGNLQLYTEENGAFTKKKVVALGDYTFERVIDPRGLFPVTAMHSIDCHAATGGWRPELDAGFEDLQYWIAAGERGFCGYWLKHTTLVYRRHQNSRFYAMRYVDKRESEMTAKIVSMHKDVYDGRYPMACCGKGKAASTNGNSAVRAGKITTLDNVRDDEKVWILYQGPKKAKFRMSPGAQSPIKEYSIEGTGHMFQAHTHDVPWFKMFKHNASDGGKETSYVLMNKSPIEPVEEIEIVEATPPREVQLAEIERLDSVAMATRGIEPEPEAQPQPELQPNGPAVIEQQRPLTQTYDLAGLGLSSTLQDTLESEGRTMEWLAAANPADLTPYDRVGIKTAKAIIASAQRALS